MLKYNFSRLQNAKVRILFEGLRFPFHPIQFEPIQFNSICNAIQFNSICNAIQFNSICNAIQFNSIQSAMQFNSIQFATQFNSIQFAMQFNSMQFNSIWNTQRQSRSPQPCNYGWRNSLPRAIFPSSRGGFLRDFYIFLFRGILCPERDFFPRVDVS